MEGHLGIVDGGHGGVPVEVGERRAEDVYGVRQGVVAAVVGGYNQLQGGGVGRVVEGVDGVDGGVDGCVEGGGDGPLPGGGAAGGVAQADGVGR